jgi:hypothetical protein
MKAILKFVGEKYWPWPQDHIKETRERGPSIRIAPNAIPDIETPYPVLFVHPRGTFHVETMEMESLLDEFYNEGHVPPDEAREVYIQEGLPTLAFIAEFRGLEPPEFKRIVEKYGVVFAPAVTHYSYITGTQVVIGDNGEGEEIVNELTAKGVDVEPVRVVRVEEGEDE